eukprot:UN3414
MRTLTAKSCRAEPFGSSLTGSTQRRHELKDGSSGNRCVLKCRRAGKDLTVPDQNTRPRAHTSTQATPNL